MTVEHHKTILQDKQSASGLRTDLDGAEGAPRCTALAAPCWGADQLAVIVCV